MSTIPSNLARFPNAMAFQIMLSSLNRTQRGLLNTQVQLATGQRVNRASDDALAAGTISVLDDVIERRDQRLRNLSHSDAVLNTLDSALADATEIMIEVKGIASSQVGIGSDAQTRENQASVIDAMLNEMFRIANRQSQNLFFFGGQATAREPVAELLGGFRYQGTGTGLTTDLGQTRPLPITLSGDEAFGALSARVKGNADLDAIMIGNTRLADLNGARSFGIGLGSINVNVGGTDLTVDLTTAHTVQDVIDTLNTQIQTLDPPATVAINAAGNAFEISGSTLVITISDLVADATAADLGINQVFPAGVPTSGSDVDPRLTEMTPVTSLTGVTTPLGTIRISNAGQTRDLDLSAATTVRDIMNAVEGLNLGVRVQIAETGDRLDFINELSGGKMSIGEVSGGALTATELGVRSLATWTRLEDFNNGRGIQIISGSVDPVTGLPDPQADLDIRVTLKDGRTFDVDFAAAETVQDVIDAIVAAAAAGGVAVPGSFDVGLAADGNGISFTDLTPPVGGTFSITALNGSFAGSDLGIIGQSTGAIMIGSDRATVAVNSVFSHLIDLRDSLLTNNELGITLAGEALDGDINRLAEARAHVGVLSRRVTATTVREEDLRIQDMSLRSQYRDLDFTEAAIRFSQLQQQLQAGLLVTSQVTSLSLLDFLS
ncbi:MAG: hypothetical protein IH888_03720 [Planctomycetes bacterium]|nr:hypothetical protein [Planctomycetota bacterium]